MSKSATDSLPPVSWYSTRRRYRYSLHRHPHMRSQVLHDEIPAILFAARPRWTALYHHRHLCRASQTNSRQHWRCLPRLCTDDRLLCPHVDGNIRWRLVVAAEAQCSLAAGFNSQEGMGLQDGRRSGLHSGVQQLRKSLEKADESRKLTLQRFRNYLSPFAWRYTEYIRHKPLQRPSVLSSKFQYFSP